MVQYTVTSALSKSFRPACICDFNVLKVFFLNIFTAFNDDGELQITCEVLQMGKQKRSKVICMVGSNNNDDARDFGENLLKLGKKKPQELLCNFLPYII